MDCDSLAPLISVLIPAYNHADGVERALSSVGPSRLSPHVEVLISDDSTLPEAQRAVAAAAAAFAPAVYRHNRLPLGAVANWNSLLAQARGRYCLLLHHDEMFESPQVFESVLALLAGPDAPDGIVLACKVVGRDGHPRLNLPTFLVRFITLRWPGYLLRRNLLGAPSVLVLRRSLYLRYDETLRSIVDVELYARVLVSSPTRLLFLPAPGLLSDGTLATSISASLREEIPRITKEELRSLESRGALLGPGSWLVSSRPMAALARGADQLAWMAFRAAQRSSQAIFRRVVASLRGN